MTDPATPSDTADSAFRLRGLLAANRMIISDLELPIVLRRIAEAACQLVNARYAALGVLAPGGGLSEFVHVGVDAAVAEAIGHLPEGKGLLGAIIDDPQPIRLSSIEDDPRSVGFPAHHPPMRSLLGVPIRVRDEVFGNLYLTEPMAGDFTAEDEELVTALAATAGVAIENARLFDEATRRQNWLEASAQITAQLLSVTGEEPLQLIARRTLEVADADLVSIVLPTADPARLMVEVAAGAGADVLPGMAYARAGSLAAIALDSAQPVLVADAQAEPRRFVHQTEAAPVGPVMVLPLLEEPAVRGVLVVGRLHGRPRFDESDLDMAMGFANHAALALALADARDSRQRMVLLEDRDRIARDLHDHVIQRLFATGLGIQSLAAAAASEELAGRLSGAVGDIDETIRQIRSSIFQLRGALSPAGRGVRARTLDIVDAIRPLLGFAPQVRFAGPVDSAVPEAVVDDLLAAVRELLTNVARHADASRAELEIRVDDVLALEVSDDGVGVGEAVRRSGLANLRMRAERLHGSLEIADGARGGPADRNGTMVRWKVPLR